MGALNLIDVNDPTWHDKAVCKQYDPAWWLNSSANSKKRRTAQTICFKQCPVRRECLRWAVDLEGRFGTTDPAVYGGRSKRLRDIIRQRWYKIYGTHPYQGRPPA